MGMRALLVEDNPDHAELMRLALLRDGRISKVDIRRDAAEALDMLARQSSRPDVILVDLRLPGMSGFELLDKLKSTAATAAIPVVLLSAFARESEVNLGLERGACGFVDKPLRPADVFACLAAAAAGEDSAAVPKRADERPPPETRP